MGDAAEEGSEMSDSRYNVRSFCLFFTLGPRVELSDTKVCQP